jgi:HTH-type transcriptional regulator/antitoxin HipB
VDECDAPEFDAPEFDASAFLPRVRRLADLSQRELADRLDVDQATVARWESGKARLTVANLCAALAVAHLRLAVVDASGREVRPFPPDTVRDNAGRRFPAHLDVTPAHRRPSNRGAGMRFDRAAARGWYALRPTRDSARPGVPPPGRPPDHPTEEDLDRAWAEAMAQLRGAQQPHEVIRCWCPDDCFDLPACTDECTCGCEARAAYSAPHE